MEPKPTYELCTLPAAEIADRWWLAFTPDHEPTAAAARFIERTDQPPQYLVRTPTMLLVGPLVTRPRQPPAPQHVYLAEDTPAIQMPLL
jgi:hypothetical protein